MARLSERIHFVPDIHAEDVLARVRALAPDLGLGEIIEKLFIRYG